MNALDVVTLSELGDRLGDLRADDDVRVIVLTGAGEKAFAAGADIKYMSELSVEAAKEWGALGHQVGQLLETKPKASIAAINGFALGGGCELALACDLRYAASTAKLGQPEVNLGIFPGWGGTQRLARATNIGYAKELILTGRMIDSAEALERGLVQHVHPPGDLMPKAMELAHLMAEKSPVALYYAKESTNRSLHGDIGGNLVHEADLYSLMFSTDDAKEGLRAFVEKRKPTFVGK